VTYQPSVQADSAPAPVERVSEPVVEAEPVDEAEPERDRGSWGTGAAAAGAGAAAIGSAYAATRGNVTDDEAARLASGADYADNEPTASTESEPVVSEPTTQEWDATETSEAEPTTQEWGTSDQTDQADQTGDTAIVGDIEDYASTEPLPAESAAPTEEPITAEPATNGVTEDASASTHDGSQDDLAERDETVETVEATEPVETAETTEPAGTGDAAVTTETVDAGDVESTDQAGETAIIGDIEDYASTEPLPAESAAPTEHSTTDESATHESTTDEWTTSEPTTEETWEDEDTSGLTDDPTSGDSATDAPAEASGHSHGSAESDAHGSAESDTPGESDWDSSAPSAERNDAETESDVAPESTSNTEATTDSTDSTDSTDGGDATHWADGTDRINPVDDESATAESTADDSAVDGSASEESVSDHSVSDESDESDESVESAETDTGAQAEGGDWSRRISGVEEIRDGGFGVGSAAPLEDRAQPADHPVQAYNDTRTFRAPGANGYDSAEPDVWFYDEEAARRAGFTPSEG